MRNKSIRNAFCLLCLALMSLLQFSCSGSSNGGKVVKHVNDLHGAVIGVQLGTTSDVLATSLEDKGDEGGAIHQKRRCHTSIDAR